MNILKIPNQRINGKLTPIAPEKFDSIALHHMAHPTADVKTVESWHVDGNKWVAIGYNFWVGLNGDIYQGRGFNQGAGVENQNGHIISIGCQGDYHAKPTTMPDAQRNGVIELCLWLLHKIPTIKKIAGHRDFMATDCPGKYFPMNEFTIDRLKSITSSIQPIEELPYKVVTLDPLNLRMAILDSIDKPYHNFVNGGYFGLHPDKSTYPEGILVDNGVAINERGVRGNETGTLFIKKNGNALITPANELRKHNLYNDCKTAISGMSILPYRQNEEGFTGVFSDVARTAPRIMLGIANGKILIVCHKNIDARKGGELMKSLGCYSAITLDGGGSTCMRIGCKDYMTSTRRINNVLWW